MKRSILKLEEVAGNGNPSSYRTIFKTKHGRVVFLALETDGVTCTITSCYYIDRPQGRGGEVHYTSKPKMLKTFCFPTRNLLSVIQTELDKQFYGVEYICTETSSFSDEAFIRAWKDNATRKYRFLVMVGDGEAYQGLPCRLRTRLKNKLHRAIYVELAYYKDGRGVVRQCYYYDRKYKRTDIKVTPPMLISCFFPYTKEGIIDLLNQELCCDFTHILVTEEIDPESNTTPLCGAL